MNPKLQSILNYLQQAGDLTADEKAALIKATRDADNELAIAEFKLERTEKVKHTTAILLEETIEELEQKRKSVEAQNHKLEIEAALEKVRSRSLAMHKSDELQQVVSVVFERLKELNISMDAANINIFSEGTRDADLWIASPGQNYASCFHLPYIDYLIPARIFNAKERGEEFFAATFSFEEKNKYFKYLFEHSDFKHLPDDRKNKMLAGDAYTVSFAFTKNAAISIHSYSGKLFSDNENDTLKRFAKVFEQAYIRFLDLQKAEVQAREANIEASLERVRSKAMAMQKSEDLANAVKIVFEELDKLSLGMMRCGIGILDKKKRSADVYTTTKSDNDTTVQVSGDESMDIHPLLRGAFEAWSKKQQDYSYELKGEDLKNYYQALTRGNFILPESQSLVSAPEGTKQYYYNAIFPAGGLFAFRDTPFPDEAKTVMKRFADVFNLTYTRFNDLKQAEAQAREAKIEAGLERVRSRTMAMQRSDELSETAFVLYQQFKELGESPIQITIGIFNEEEGVIEFWVTDMEGNKIDHMARAAFDEPTLIKKIVAAWKAQKKSTVIELAGKELQDWVTYRQDLSGIKDNQDYSNSRRCVSVAFFSKGLISLSTPEPKPKELIQLLERFAGVFDGTYTRFNDLKQAEAQARESQIQLAMERVRASTMAMQHSNDLYNVINVVKEQLQVLGFHFDSANFITDMDNNGVNMWLATSLQAFPFQIHVPAIDHILFTQVGNAIASGSDFETYSLTNEEKNSYFKNFFENTVAKNVPDETKKLVFDSKGMAVSSVILEKIILSISNFEAIPYTAEENAIIKRFGYVFEQSYTRFLDLQKAEAQAREAQIQLALERVRARTMAMQHSDELKDAAALLFQQAKTLGVPAYSCGYNIWEKEDKVFTSWMSTQDGSIINGVPNIPLTEDANFIRYAESKQKGEQFFVLELRGDRMQEHYEYLKMIPAFKTYFDYAISVGFDLPETQIHYVANFSHGNLLFISLEPCPEFHDVFKRFAAVFEQTYTRFLDLQKAEAQAREAQIELGLERVRARAMAMQKSGELSELVDTVFKELTKLDFALTWCIINIIDESTMSNTVWAANPDISKAPESYHMLFEDYPFHHAMMKGWKERKIKYVYTLEGNEKKIYDDYLFTETEFKRTPEVAQAASRAMEKYVVSFSFSNFGGLQTVGDVPLSEANLDILSRFGKVFDLTYTRFNDLKQAEEQARESQIQLALERVRARTMAMQKSEELQSTALLLFQQVAALGVPSIACGFNIWDEDKKEATAWMASREDALLPPFKTSSSKDVFLQIYEAAQRGESLFVVEQEGKTLEDHYQYMASIPIFKDVMEKLAQAGLPVPTFQIIHCAFFSQGYLMFISYEPVPEAYDIFKRFANVFEQTYTRFLDLQKSEAQAREAQIEAALERVRSRSMGMQKSEELKEVIKVVYEQFVHLNIHIEHTGFIMDYKERDDMHIWLADQHEVPSEVTIPYFDCAHWNSFNEARKNGRDFFANQLDFEEKNKFYQGLFKLIPGLPEETKEYYVSCPGLAISTVLLENVGLYIENFSGIPYTDEENNTLMRFGKVFQQTYTRFLDLKKAEAQAREARIEAALEKVRSRTMAMQKSEELSDTAYILFQQFKELGENPIQITIGIFNEPEGLIEFRVTDWSGGGSRVGDAFNVSIEEPTLIRKIYEAWKQQQRSIVTDLSGQELEDWIKYRNVVSKVPVHSDDTGGRRVITTAFFSKGHITFSTPAPRPLQTIQLLERFAGVFDLTYTRFLDLKLAEAQARKERIEAALERVRSSSLAMHKTDELKNVVKVVFENLRSLGLKSIDAVNINIFHKGSKDFDLWIAAPGQDYTKNFRIPYLNHPIANDFFDTVQKGGTLHKKLYAYEVKNEYFKYTFENSDNKYLPEERKQLVLNGSAYCVTAAIAKHSSIFVHNYNGEIFSAEDDEIILRFSRVFDQAYKRYLDLQKAELLMRDAVKQASLDRIRGQVASMRSAQDLQRITPLIWQELGKLDIPFIRCGVFIMDEEHGIMQAYLSTPHGESLAVLHLPYNYDEVTIKTVDHWRRKEIFRHHWNKEQFAQWMKSMIRDGLIENQEAFQGGTVPPDSLDLHFIPFPQGMLYVGAIKSLLDYELNLVTSLAEAFSVAYSRYEDFTKLERAKLNIETTLAELKGAQSQLIQAEKMASLGELTAGIAHEIQNPLNFVNNFSEVSNELLDEMKEELSKGNNEYAITIAEDVKQNLEKINHHGKRADAIVKGMLQHSRSSSGVKEPTDMNALADEYLRLCYHGLRAKDKSFNATMKTDFNESIEKINVIPQEIGRVLLNLLTNAFYAVNEKRKLLKSEGRDYEPTVSVATGNENGKLIIKIKDNGLGIPQHVLDKIFQPFFTTKPAGEGTGLGLSLSYDIIKVHGGEIKVNTKESEGSEFVMYLPFN